ncbi:MAG: acyltransferase [Gammaproteobacteria bacterium]|uniref:acyltransferase family protein n=1 Tax=Methylotuvimicrobium sp. TaxID=2822413 RepID=UPI001DBCFAF5|nr:acyltransferase [Gammaproteobacteria bacterium]
MSVQLIESKSISSFKTANRLAFADGLRGFAAFWVVLYHMSEGKHLEHIKSLIPHSIYAAVFDAGHLGVGVFFVLSGFVMAYTVRQATVNRSYAVNFLLRRMIRLTPPYYFAIIVTLVLAFVKGKAMGLPYEFPDITQFLAHAFYMQGLLSIPHFNIVYWTLCVEVQFYIVFALLFFIADSACRSFDGHKARSIVVGLMAVIALCWPLGLISKPLWPGAFFEFWFSLLAGVLVCWSLLMGGYFRLYAVLFCLVLLFAGLINASQLTLTVAATGLVMSCASAFDLMNTWLNWRWIQWLALISYSLYLLHNPITGLSFRVVHLLMPSGITADIIGIAITLAFCLIGSYLAYCLIEKPCIRWSHAISLGPKSAQEYLKNDKD